MAFAKELQTGESFGHYLLDKKLGEGGCGEVWLAHHARLTHKPPVAIKFVLRPRPQELARFEREVTILDLLRSNSHIIKAEDFGEEGNIPFLVMEYAAGGSLSARLGSKLALEVAGNYLAQAADGLDFAHQNGIIHRDLKPSNILFSANDILLLADFGIAHQDNYEFTEDGMGLGTPEYMAPEQFSDAKHAGIGADVYSLGIIAFQMLTGRLPFGSRKEGKSLYELITAHVNQPVPVLTDLSADLSTGLHSVFEKALAKNPAERYQSASAFTAAFHRVIAQEEPTKALFFSEKEPAAPSGAGTLDLAVSALPSPMPAEPSVTVPLPATPPALASSTQAAQTPGAVWGAAGKNRTRLIIGLVGGLAALVIILALALLLTLTNPTGNSPQANNPGVATTNLAALADNKISATTQNPKLISVAPLSYPVLDYPGWQKAPLPDRIIQQAIALDNVSNITFTRGEFYTINPDEVAKLKVFLKSELEDKAKWKNITSLTTTLLGVKDAADQLEGIGGFYLGYQNGNLLIFCFGLPGVLAKTTFNNAPEIDSTKYYAGISYGRYTD